MKRDVWNPTKYKDTSYWAYQLDTPEHITHILLYHQREGKQKFPYLFVFNEEVGIDHWWGGRQRFGHDHKFEFLVCYFDPNGSGDLIDGDCIDWIPHYLLHYTSSKIDRLSLDDNTRRIISELPDKDALKLISAVNDDSRPLDDVEIIQRTGAMYESLFELYQDPLLFAEEREAILDEYRRRAEQTKCMLSIARGEGEETPHEPTFDAKDTHDRMEFLLRILKRAAEYDIHAQLTE